MLVKVAHMPDVAMRFDKIHLTSTRIADQYPVGKLQSYQAARVFAEVHHLNV